MPNTAILTMNAGPALQPRTLSHQILLAQEEERKRISRELHDVIAQTLVGINLHLRALSQQATVDPKGLKKKIARTQRLVEESVDVVHRFARELRPTSLDNLGLVPALRAHLHEVSVRTGLQTRLAAPPEIDELDSGTRTVLYRIAQEALTNVIHHADAERVTVTLERTPRTVRMSVADDGCGFVTMPVTGVHDRRLGLLGMRERAQMIGGMVTIDSAPGRGTTVHVELPA